MKLLQILYPGLGGHTSVATSLISGDHDQLFDHYLLGYGIEKPSENLRSFQLKSVVKNQGIDLNSFKQVFDEVLSIKPDAIIVHSTSQVITIFFYSLFHKVNWLAVEHQANTAKTKLDWIYSFVILLFAPKVVYLTEAYKKEMMNKFPLLTKKKKIAVIRNGIDLNRFTPGSRISDGIINITMISRLNKLRDHHTLINAFYAISKKKNNVRLKIAGDGETYADIKELIKSLHLQDKVQLLGFLNETEIIGLLHQTDIYIHSSLAETQSTSLLQVMACKVPIIATNIDGIFNLLNHNKEALLFECFDTKELVQYITLLLNNQKLSSLLIENAFLKIKNSFSSEDMFIQYFNFINEK